VVTYDLALDEKKRLRAVSVSRSAPIRPESQATSMSRSNSTPVVVASLFVLFVIAETLWGPLPPAVIATYSAVSILTFLAHWFRQIGCPTRAKRARALRRDTCLLRKSSPAFDPLRKFKNTIGTA
jgi:hypothetical protein